MNKENPTHVKIMTISLTKCDTFRGNVDIQAQVIPQLFGHTTMVLRDFDYLLIAQEYEEYVERIIRSGDKGEV